MTKLRYALRADDDESRLLDAAIAAGFDASAEVAADGRVTVVADTAPDSRERLRSALRRAQSGRAHAVLFEDELSGGG